MNSIKNLICIVGVGLALTSCVTTTKTAKTGNFTNSRYSATIADLDVASKRVTHTMQPTKEVQRGGVGNVKRAVVAEAIEKAEQADGKSYDILLEPEYVTETKRGLFSSKITKISVSGRPAAYKNFRSFNDSVWANPVFRGAKVVYVNNGSAPAKSAVGGKFKAPKEKSSKESDRKGYAGYIEFSPIWAIDKKRYNGYHDNTNTDGFAMELSTVHGYNISRKIFVGGGVGVKWNVDVERAYIPIFANARWNITGQKKTPFVDLRLGTQVIFHSSEKNNPAYYRALAIGYSFGKFDIALSRSEVEYDYPSYTGLKNRKILNNALRFSLKL